MWSKLPRVSLFAVLSDEWMWTYYANEQSTNISILFFKLRIMSARICNRVSLSMLDERIILSLDELREMEGNRWFICIGVPLLHTQCKYPAVSLRINRLLLTSVTERGYVIFHLLRARESSLSSTNLRKFHFFERDTECLRKSISPGHSVLFLPTETSTSAFAGTSSGGSDNRWDAYERKRCAGVRGSGSLLLCSAAACFLLLLCSACCNAI